MYYSRHLQLEGRRVLCSSDSPHVLSRPSRHLLIVLFPYFHKVWLRYRGSVFPYFTTHVLVVYHQMISNVVLTSTSPSTSILHLPKFYGTTLRIRKVCYMSVCNDFLSFFIVSKKQNLSIEKTPHSHPRTLCKEKDLSHSRTRFLSPLQ